MRSVIVAFGFVALAPVAGAYCPSTSCMDIVGVETDAQSHRTRLTYHLTEPSVSVGWLGWTTAPGLPALWTSGSYDAPIDITDTTDWLDLPEGEQHVYAGEHVQGYAAGSVQYVWDFVVTVTYPPAPDYQSSAASARTVLSTAVTAGGQLFFRIGWLVAAWLIVRTFATRRAH